MLSPGDTKLSQFQCLPFRILWKSVAIACLIIALYYTFSISIMVSTIQTSDLFLPFQSNAITTDSPTNISHIGFIVIGSLRSWKHRHPYTRSWWLPNVTRGYLFLDKEPTQEFLPWPSASPPYRVNEDITKLRLYPHFVSPIQVRMFRSILDMHRVGDKGLRWFIMCDDDTLFMVHNLVEVLGKYDHNKLYYIGGNSECVQSNYDFSFDMGFGGAGYALSYPLMEALSTKIDACIERYFHLNVSDYMAQSCIADLGVSLTIEKGIHQIDLTKDISGFLSSHPQSPFLSLHHFDIVTPIFPSMNRHESVRHLMKAAKCDQSRILQQTICYQRETNWSFSVSWGYSVHVYESILPRSILRKPIETFKPWFWSKRRPFYMFNTRLLTNNSCDAPHVFFFRSIKYTGSGNQQLLTTYVRASPRNLPPCSAAANRSADPLSKIRVITPAKTRKTMGEIECCDVEYKAEKKIADIKIRSCMKDEVLA